MTLSANMKSAAHNPIQLASAILILALVALGMTSAIASEVGCVKTAWKLIGANHQVCVQAFHDPKVPGITCHVSQAKTGGIKGSLGVAKDPSQFSLACRQTGPITLPAKLPEKEIVFSESTSLLFKDTEISRLWDAENNTLVYLAISRKVIEGSPANSISTVPVMPWGGR
jgi:CreA protein